MSKDRRPGTDQQSAKQASTPGALDGILPFPVTAPLTAADRVRICERLHARHWGAMMRFAGSYLAEDDAEDVVQHAFIQLWHNYLLKAKLADEANWDAVIVSLVRLRTLDQLRRRKTRRKKYLLLAAELREVAHRWMNPSDVMEARRAKRVIEDGIAKMTPRGREMFLLHFKADMSVREIAEALGVGRETAKKLLQRSNRIMRDHASIQGFGQESKGDSNDR